jgi:rRNA-processing protein FCF1
LKQRRKNRKTRQRGKCTLAPTTTRRELTHGSPQVSSALFFQANTALGPPYHVLVDTNFLGHTVQAKLELDKALMDLLYAKATPIITTCVMAELEKLGPKYRIALRIARDERWERLKWYVTMAYTLCVRRILILAQRSQGYLCRRLYSGARRFSSRRGGTSRWLTMDRSKSTGSTSWQQTTGQCECTSRALLC